MGRIDIRDIDDSVILKLNDMASDKKISREELCRRILKNAVIELELKTQENKYLTLVESLVDVIKQNTEVMERTEYMLLELLEKE